MRLWIALLFSLAVGNSAAQQVFEEMSVNPDLRHTLDGKRLERLRSALEGVKLSSELKGRALATNDAALLQSVLFDRSKRTDKELELVVRARTDILDLAASANKPEVSRILKNAGIEPDSLYVLAVSAERPEVEGARLRSKLGVTKTGGFLLRQPGVLITKPELIADDNLAPGKVIPGQTPANPVWRTGLTFAVLIAKTGQGSPVAHCSGTLVGPLEVLTAAHCLLNDTTASLSSPSGLVVYLPFQNGTETVLIPGGRKNSGMRRIGVDSVSWIGEDTNDVFPGTLKAFTPIIQGGKDLAVLKLNSTQVLALPIQPITARLHSGSGPVPPTSAVGYGISDSPQVGPMTLMVGVRNTLPSGVEKGEERLRYADNETSGLGGICGGDSGGGLFVGRIDGTSSSPVLMGVISGLVSDVPASNSGVCLASEQSHSSLLTNRNRKFVCSRAPAACG